MNHIKAFAICLIAFGIVVWSFAANAQTAPAAIPTLKAEATISGDLVRIGDVVENAGLAASTPIFRAPELGSSGTIQVHRVMEALRQSGILVFDTRNLTEILVTRASRTVSLNDLGRAIADATAKRYEFSDPKDIQVTFDANMRALNVEPNLRDAPRIANVIYDSRSNRFEAIVDMPGSLSLRRNPVRLTGTLVETAEVVTLARAVARGETIRESDIVMERLPRADVGPDALSKIELVANQAARRAMRTGQTLRTADLMKPQIVNRDEAVTIIFRTAGITLTARGKALGNGAEGDMVPVMNPQSKRTVQATVTAPGVVTVGDVSPVTTAAINNR